MKSADEKLSEKALSGVDTVKLFLCETFEESFKIKYQVNNKEHNGELAEASANEIFGSHTEESLRVFNENRELIIDEIKNLGATYPELKRIITDSIRIYMIAKFRLYGKFPENYEETFNNAIERGIFIKGGEVPEIITFLISIEDSLRRKKID